MSLSYLFLIVIHFSQINLHLDISGTTIAVFYSQLFCDVPDKRFVHNLLSPTAGNTAVGGIAKNRVIRHCLKFYLQHFIFHGKDHYK